jgi:hypothetical protein
MFRESDININIRVNIRIGGGYYILLKKLVLIRYETEIMNCH